METKTAVLAIVGLGVAAYAATQAYASTSLTSQPSSNGFNYPPSDYIPDYILYDTSTPNQTSFYDPFTDWSWEALGSTTEEIAMATETNSTSYDAYWKTNDYPKYASLIATAEQGQGIPTDLLGRLLFQESSYDPDIISGKTSSRAGALGIAQFMPPTAIDVGIGISGALNPTQAIPAAARYLRQMYNQFHTWSNALAAYNAGPGNWSKYLSGGDYTPKAETLNYVAQITKDVNVA